MVKSETVAPCISLTIFCSGLSFVTIAVASLLWIFTDLHPSEVLLFAAASAILFLVGLILLFVCLLCPLICLAGFSILLAKFLTCIEFKWMSFSYLDHLQE